MIAVYVQNVIINQKNACFCILKFTQPEKYAGYDENGVNLVKTASKIL